MSIGSIMTIGKTIRQVWNWGHLVYGVLFLMLINMGFGALVKAWIRGTIKRNNAIGLSLLIIPMAIIYGLILRPIWAAKHGKDVHPRAQQVLYFVLVLLGLSFIGGFYIDVDF